MALAATKEETAAAVFTRVKLYMARPPLMPIGRTGGCLGSKCWPKINLTAWLPAAAEPVSSLISLGFLRCRSAASVAARPHPQRGEKRLDDVMIPVPGPPDYGRAACQPTTASASASVEAK